MIVNRSRRRVLVALASLSLVIACGPAAHGAHRPFSKPLIRVGIILFNGVEPIDYAGPYEVFAQAGFSVATVSADGKAVTGMGLKVVPDYSFANAPPFDVLVVPGGSVGGAEHDPALIAFIRQRAANAHQVLSVCTGAYILAASGLLDGLHATTFTESLRHLAASYPKIHVIGDARWADNGKIVTSAGLTTGIAAALHVVARLKGIDVARSIAMRMEYAWQPNAKMGFVRGDMADRYIPDLGRVWPKDIHFGSILAFGSATGWHLRARVDTKLPPQALLSRIDQAVGRAPGWREQTSLRPHHWSKREGGKLIELSFSSGVVERGGYELGATVRVHARSANADHSVDPSTPAPPARAGPRPCAAAACRTPASQPTTPP